MNSLALYYRASNEDGNAGESATIRNQRDLLRYFVKNQAEFADWSVMEFQDDGWSGTTFDRPGIQKVLKMAGKEIQCIIVKDFSRFGRNLIAVGDYLDRVFPFLGVRFISVNENFDSLNNSGHTIGLDVSLKAMVYEMYSRDLSKKISSVKEGQMRKGRYAGSWAFYGYQRSDSTSSGLEIDPEAAATVKRIFSLAASGIAAVDITVMLNREGVLPPLSYRRRKKPDERYYCPTATAFNVWTQDRISAIIRDERYTGVLIGKKRKRIDIISKKQKPIDEADWFRIENALDATISKQEYEQAQKALSCRSKRSGSPATELFRGLLKCGHCGKTLVKIPGKAPCFRCETGRFKPNMLCRQICVSKKDLEQLILSLLPHEFQLILQEGESLTKAAALDIHISQKSDKLMREIKKHKTQQAILFEQFACGILDRARLSAEKLAITKRLEEIAAEQKTLTAMMQNKNQAHCDAKSELNKPAIAQGLPRDMLIEAVQLIRVFPDHAFEIVWNFSDTNTDTI